MRILMLCPQFRPLIGGYERAAERLSRELVRQGAAVTVITDRRDPQWPARENLDGVQVIRLWCWFRPRLHLATSLFSHTLWLLMHGRRFDVWHVHQYGTHGTLAVLMGKLLRRPVVLKLTNSGIQGIENALAEARFSRLQCWAHRHVDACVALTAETMREALAFRIPKERVFEIGNGVEIDNWIALTSSERDSLHQSLGLPARPTFICVGRLVEAKNHLGLLDAWSRAHGRFAEPWILVLVGDGPLRPRLEQLVNELGLRNSVFLVGAQSNVRDWLRAADIFVLASNNEGLANTVLEAQTCGLPCIVTAVSGMQQLIGECDAGRIVPIGNPLALADAMVEMQTGPDERIAMGMRGRGSVTARYSMSVIVARYIELYRLVVHQGRSE